MTVSYLSRSLSTTFLPHDIHYSFFLGMAHNSSLCRGLAISCLHHVTHISMAHNSSPAEVLQSVASLMSLTLAWPTTVLS